MYSVNQVNDTSYMDGGKGGGKNGGDKPKYLEAIGILVPTDKVGKVIGKSGAGLKMIREGSGQCRCEVQSEVLTGGVRRCNLGGSVDQISKGFAILAQAAYAHELQPQVQILVAEDWAGLVAGKGGENLRYMRETCQVKCTLERENYGGERMVSMEGGVANLASALRIIIQGGNRAAAKDGSAMFAPSYGEISNVRPVNQDPEVMQVHMVVHSKACGGIMGKGGDQLKQFEKMTGAKLAVSEFQGSADRRVVIIGSSAQCAAAQRAIYEALCEMAPNLGIVIDDITTHCLIRSDACGAIVGKSGENLKRIRESCGVRLDMGKSESKGQRPCTLKGSLQNVLRAQNMIADGIKGQDLPVVMPGAPGSNNGPQKRPAPSSFVDGLSSTLAIPTPFTNNAPQNTKRARTDPSGDDADTIKMLIPAQLAGTVIGKQGSGLKQIREGAGVNITVIPQDQTPYLASERMVVLSGASAAKQQAIDMILKVITPEHQYNDTIMKLLVKSQSAGKLIGKQAVGLKTIRETFGVQMQVDREEVFGERLVSVQGMLQAVSAASGRILSSLE